VEVPAALNRRVREGTLNVADAATGITDFEHDLNNQYNAIQVTDPLVASAAVLIGRNPLRAYDAIQLAAALEVNGQIRALGPQTAVLLAMTMVGADRNLNNAAAAEGLAIDNPNNHP
jgi:hypothetical protein